MKRLIGATLAMTLLGGTAAVADPYDHDGNGGYGRGYDGDHYRGDYHRHDGDGAAIVAGVGFLTLAAILASQHHDHYRHDGWYNRDGGYRYDGGYAYRGGYDRDGDRHNGNGYYRRGW